MNAPIIPPTIWRRSVLDASCGETGSPQTPRAPTEMPFVVLQYGAAHWNKHRGPELPDLDTPFLGRIPRSYRTGRLAGFGG